MIIFLYGEDNFRSAEKLIAIKKRFLENSNLGAIPSVIDFAEDPRAKLDAAIKTGGLFSEKQLIIAKNIISESDKEIQEEILDFLKRKKDVAEDKNTVLVFWENNLPKKNNSFFKFLEKTAKKENFEKLKGAKLEKWITQKLQAANPGADFSKNALAKLIIYTDGNMFQLNEEISKLANCKEKGIIEESDVEILVKAKMNANIFATIEALSSGNKKNALKLLHNQMREGGDPFYILSMYIFQFRNLLKVSEFSARGIFDQYRITQETGLHSFVIQKCLAQMRNFTSEKLKKIYKKLQEMDLKIKTGKIDIKLALDKFVADL